MFGILIIIISKAPSLLQPEASLVTPAGFEPATFGAEIRNSIQLNYGAISGANIVVYLY